MVMFYCHVSLLEGKEALKRHIRWSHSRPIQVFHQGQRLRCGVDESEKTAFHKIGQ